jgi:hypothetical protein
LKLVNGNPEVGPIQAAALTSFYKTRVLRELNLAPPSYFILLIPAYLSSYIFYEQTSIYPQEIHSFIWRRSRRIKLAYLFGGEAAESSLLILSDPSLGLRIECYQWFYPELGK